MGILTYRPARKVRRLLTFFALGILGILLATACAKNSQPDLQSAATDAPAACRTFQHQFGETEICGQPTRIIAFDPPALDMLLSLDIQPVGLAGAKANGYDQDQTVEGAPQLGAEIDGVSYFGDRLTSRPIYVGTLHTPSLEAILALKPDLIVGRYVNEAQYATMSKVAPVLPLNTDQTDWQQDFLVLAETLDRTPQAQQVVERYEQKIAAAKTALNPVNQNATALILDMIDLGQITVLTTDNYMGVLLEKLGFQLMVPDSPASSVGIAPISVESLPQMTPDLIMVLERGSLSAPIKRQWATNPILQSVKNQAKHLVFADFYLWATLEGPIGAEYMIDDLQAQLSS
ncbi:iron-siderophore ABC transporter substrate-binding protein [Leptolyngbya sp. CCNP1308]|uniref:ABC transporter substrate-binding protein n=1 Tax=Leptolyngbya sp. CCNP1308 TaxID=3110255 RepID=UPI002B1F0AFA|nr:iron-siderophore ABC transporter substrate-binding protein [Leptolyngbya sp. CCNP1308]MEA5451758.1 iron-siderophore ABC transporter substrate-binding protein [Leptolyngbya sp. CCNP1308]